MLAVEYFFVVKKFLKLSEVGFTFLLADYESCGVGGNTQSRGIVKDALSTKHGAWPWTVLIVIDGKTRCTGALLNNEWVLTAESCVNSQNLSSMAVVLGTIFA